MDKLDIALVKILAERISLIPKVDEFKKINNIERYIPEREQEIFKKKRALAEKLNLNPNLVEDIFKRIIQESHIIEEKILGK